MTLFDSLGFRWDRDTVPRQLPRASLNRVTFRFSRMLPEYVWDAGVLEGNRFTFPEVKTLLEGVTVGGRKLSDQEQILNLGESSKYLLELVKRDTFKLDKDTFCSLNARVARNEALEWGHFRGESIETAFTPDVALGALGRFTPLPTEKGAQRLNEVFAKGLHALEENVENPFERATAFFLFGSFRRFFFDGNRRTSRFMMNGLLMREGIDAISIPAVRASVFNSLMVDFYSRREATQMMAFVLDCHPEIGLIRQLNPWLPLIKDAPQIEYHSDDSLGIPASGKAAPAGTSEGVAKGLSAEETQRNAAENWKRKYHERQAGVAGPERELTDTKENAPGASKTNLEKDAGIDFDPQD